MRGKLLSLAVAGLFFIPPLAFWAGRVVPPTEVYAARFTPRGLPIRLVIFGDTREESALEFWEPDTTKERNVVIDAIVAEAPAFVINSGDLVLAGDSADAWGRFDRENAPFRERGIPYYPALGNHEYRGRDDLATRNLFDRFPAMGGRKWYTIEAVNTWFVLLDSNIDDLRDDEVEAQDRFLDERLAAAAARVDVKFVVLVFHHPYYTNSSMHGPAKEVRAHFLDRMERCAKAKALFAGHVHTIERFEIGGRRFVNSGGGGAPLTGLRTGDTPYKDLYPGGEYRRFNYCVLTIREDRIDVEIKEMDKERVFSTRDRFVIE